MDGIIYHVKGGPSLINKVLSPDSVMKMMYCLFGGRMLPGLYCYRDSR